MEVVDKKKKTHIGGGGGGPGDVDETDGLEEKAPPKLTTLRRRMDASETRKTEQKKERRPFHLWLRQIGNGATTKHTRQTVCH